MLEELLAFLGVFLGCLARSTLPFVRKLRRAAINGRDLRWDHRYTVSLAASAFLGFVAASLITPAVPPTGPLSPLAIFCTSFALGFGSNGILNELMKQAGVA